MKGFVCNGVIALLTVSSLLAQQRTRPSLRVSCTADRSSYAPSDTMNLTTTVENVGRTDVYVYGTMEWGWAAIGFKLTDETGHAMPLRKRIDPLPPPPVYDKSQLVGLAPGYFFGTHLAFPLSDYDLKPGVYYLVVSYHSDHFANEGFGLPILTSADGEYVSNKVQLEIHPR